MYQNQIQEYNREKDRDIERKVNKIEAQQILT